MPVRISFEGSQNPVVTQQYPSQYYPQSPQSRVSYQFTETARSNQQENYNQPTYEQPSISSTFQQPIYQPQSHYYQSKPSYNFTK